jgi:hypothetical protein
MSVPLAPAAIIVGLQFTKFCTFFKRGENAFNQGDLHLPGHDTDQRQCAMEWPTTV